MPADNHPPSPAETSGFEFSDLMFISLQIQEIKKKTIRNALDFNSLIAPAVPLIHTAKEMRPQTSYPVPMITVCVAFQCKRLQAFSFDPLPAEEFWGYTSVLGQNSVFLT